MAEQIQTIRYWGLKAIAARLGYRHYQSVTRAIAVDHLPAYRRRHHLSRGRYVWYIEESLILLWQVAQAQQHRKKLIAELSSANSARARKWKVKAVRDITNGVIVAPLTLTDEQLSPDRETERK